MAVAHLEKTIDATMHFAADPHDGGAFSNDDDSLTRQNLEPQTVAIGDARGLSPPASLARLVGGRPGHPFVRHVLTSSGGAQVARSWTEPRRGSASRSPFLVASER